MSTSRMHATALHALDLAPDLEGYQLLLRQVVFEPGSRSGLHSHQERPAFKYILEGTLTVGNAAGDVREYTSGEVITESRDVTHWGENRGASAVVMVSVELLKQP